MLETVILPIKKINTTRKVKDSLKKEQLALATSLTKKGQLTPILVDESYNLIDGLRRMRAAEQTGFTDIVAVVSTSYDESIATLAVAHEPSNACLVPLTPLRIWELSCALKDQMWARVGKLRLEAIKGNYVGSRDNQARTALANALHLPAGGTLISTINFFYARTGFTDEVGAFARLAVKKMESEEWTPYSAKKAYERWNRERGRKSDEATQRQILSRAAIALTGIMRPLSDVGALHHGLTDDELYLWVQQLHDARSVLTTTINKIRKERESRSK